MNYNRIGLMLLCLIPMVVGTLDAQQPKGIDLLKKRIAQVGKLKFRQTVPIRYVNKSRLKDYIKSRFQKEYSPELSAKDAVFIRLMGFVDRTIDVRKVRERILLNNVGGMYDDKTKELVVLDTFREIDYINSMVMIHELRHSLQDSYFNLTQLLEKNAFSDFDDRKLALLAAMDGDATFTMVQCNGLDAGILTSSYTADALMSIAPVPKTSLFYREPAVIKYQFIMPYLEGLRFVNMVFRKKKWKGVNRILGRPPISTEQVLHPNKYFNREYPVNVGIQYRPEGYELFHSGVIGEYYLNILLKPEGQEEIVDVANGWGGDTFHIYKHPQERSYFLAWESEWDKDIFCSRFYSDFKRFLENHFKVNLKKGTASVSIKPGKKGAETVSTFWAGRGGIGEKDYFFITKSETKIFYARSNNRKQMNTFIYGGNYD
ncbi:MAG: hypothetical protein GY940_30010 [bacterium]|nr:hypothetical protein [bacterium]